MAKHSIAIKGVADFSSISKEVEDLQKTIGQAFGKTGAKILDAKSVDFLKKETNQAFDKMTKQMGKLRKEAEYLEKALKNTAKDEKAQVTLSAKRLDNIKRMVSLEKELNNLGKSRQDLEPESNVIPIKGRKASFGGLASRQISSGISGVASELPGVSQGAQVAGGALSAGQAAGAAGMGMGAIAGLAVLGAAAAGAALAVSRMAAGFETFKQAIPNLLTLSGMGLSPNRGIQGEAAGLGYNQLETFEAQKQLGSAFGNAGSGQADSNRLLNVMTASRDLGITPGQIAGGGETLRAAGGTESAQKQMALILEKAVTSGMDKTQASAYLSASVALLSEINQSGVSNSSNLLNVMTGLVAKGNMSPEMAAKSIGGLSGAIAGSSGESNAFFQNAAARGGLGGGSLLGTQFAVRQGLSGVDMGALGNQIGDTKSGKMGMQAIGEMGLGSGDFSQKFAKNILGEINQRFDQSTKEGRQATLGFAGQMFGSKTAPEAARALALLEKISTGSANETDKKLMENLTKDPDQAWREKTLSNLDQIAIATQKMASLSENAKYNLGESSAPVFNKLTESVIALDDSIRELLKAGGLDKASSFDNIGEKIWDAITGAFEWAFDEMPKAIGKNVNAALGMDERGVIGVGEDLGRKAINGVSNMLGFGNAVDTEGDAKRAIRREAENLDSFRPGESAGGSPGESSSQMPGHGPMSSSEMLNEQKKTNILLERIARPGGAPRAGRASSRP